MKTTTQILNVFTLAAGVALLVGCASTGNDKAASASATLTKSSELIGKGPVLIDRSLAALNDLVNYPQPDLRNQFKAFNASVNELGSTAKDVAGKAETMKSKGAAYFAKWDEELALIKNEDIRKRSEARKTEVASKFTRISQSYDETRTAFQPFMSDLRDVQKYLSTDLTAGGLSSIKTVAAKAQRDAEPVKKSLSKLSDEFKDLGVSMSSTGPAK